MDVIKTEKLTKYYGKSRGIMELDLTVAEGEFFGFIGPNGAGKSTTIRTLLGLIAPTSGSAMILGKDVTKEVLSIPRGFSMSNGEILNSPQINQEDAYQEEFWSFGFTDDNKPLLGFPQVNINVKNQITNTNTTADGLNRLPANDALILYSDKGCLNNYALDDAYEVVID